MLLPLVYTLLPTLILAQGAGDLCHNELGDLGICESTTWCGENGGWNQAGLCPGGPSWVECCWVPRCDGGAGNCISEEDCLSTSNGHVVKNMCPGPSNYICCVAS